MTREEVKRHLHEYQSAIENLDTARRNLEAVENQLTGISIDYSQERVTSSAISFDRIGDQVDQLAELRQTFEERKKRAIDLMIVAVRLINLCQNARGYDLLSRRYLHGKTWDELESEMHYSFRHLLRIHADAIDEIVRNSGGDVI